MTKYQPRIWYFVPASDRPVLPASVAGPRSRQRATVLRHLRALGAFLLARQKS